MNKIQGINDKINKLKNLKLQVETRLTRELYKKIEATLGEEFTPQLAMAIVNENWNNASREQKEKWRSNARAFSSSQATKISTGAQEKIHATP